MMCADTCKTCLFWKDKGGKGEHENVQRCTQRPGHGNLGELLHSTPRAMRRVRKGIPGRVRLFFFFFFWLQLVFVAVHRLSLVVASGAHSLVSNFSLRWSLLLWNKVLGLWVSVVLAHRLSCSTPHGIFLDQGSNQCPLHWPVDS